MIKKITWRNVITQEKKMTYFQNILYFIAKKRAAKINIYPQDKDIFNAFLFTELHEIKIVILGQDPYHGPNQAHGLSFSVKPGLPPPASLINIYKELANDIPNFITPNHGFLQSWAKQGVMLLNLVLTVESGKACSHFNIGWETFTDKVIKIINMHREGVIFLLWGSYAHKKSMMIDHKRHHVFKAPHPSPLSAYRGFFGCHHFSQANSLLIHQKQKPIDWIPRLNIYHDFNYD